MPQVRQVLIFTHEHTMRNFFEQVFIVCGARTVVVETIPAAKAMMAQVGLAAFDLVAIDTAALGNGELRQQDAAGQLLREWTAERPDLPVLFVGTRFQQYAILDSRPDTVKFLVKPFRLDELVNAVKMLRPPKAPSAHLLTVDDKIAE